MTVRHQALLQHFSIFQPLLGITDNYILSRQLYKLHLRAAVAKEHIAKDFAILEYKMATVICGHPYLGHLFPTKER